MNKKVCLLYVFAPVIFFSCATVSNTTPETDTAVRIHAPAETTAGTIPQPDTEMPAQQEIQQTAPEVSPADRYKKEASLFTIRKISTPEIPVCGRSFSKPFTVQVLHSATMLPAQKTVIAEYPAAKTDGIISFAQTELIPDENGTVSFMPPKTAFACNSTVKFYIKPEDSVTAATLEDMQTMQAAIDTYAYTADYRVKTNLTASGGSIALVDFDKNGAPITTNSKSSSALLTALIQARFTSIGNSDFTRHIVSGDTTSLISDAKKLFGNAVTYFIYGTVAYAEPVSTAANGMKTVKLTGKISCVNLKTGTVYFSVEETREASAKTEYDALLQARNKLLAEDIAQMVIYGM